MTRISSLLVASTLAILPISAFAQQTPAPAKTADPAATTTTAPSAAPVAGKTATTMTPAKSEAKTETKTEMKAGKTATTKHDVKTPMTAEKSDAHSTNTTAGHAKVPAKPVEPTKG